MHDLSLKHTYVCNINIPFPFMECVRLLACMMHCCSLVISNLGYGVFRQNKQNSFRVPEHKHTFYSTWNIYNFGHTVLHTFDTMLSQIVAKACAHDSRWLSDYYEIKISASSWLWECTWISMLTYQYMYVCTFSRSNWFSFSLQFHNHACRHTMLTNKVTNSSEALLYSNVPARSLI